MANPTTSVPHSLDVGAVDGSLAWLARFLARRERGRHARFRHSLLGFSRSVCYTQRQTFEGSLE